jgi:hypothetical protein
VTSACLTRTFATSALQYPDESILDYCKEKDCVQEERMAREQINLGIKMQGGLPYTDWSRQEMVKRRANGGRDDPHTYCKPPNYPRAWTLPQHTKIIQTPQERVILRHVARYPGKSDYGIGARHRTIEARQLRSAEGRDLNQRPQGLYATWSVTIEMALQADTQMLEEICLDNELFPVGIRFQFSRGSGGQRHQS